MAHQLFQVDAFTKEPFKGNPAAVCLLDGPMSADGMQSLASEMNLSETAFLQPVDGGWQLRWFTPTTEVDLCGHATLASARVLFETLSNLKGTPIRFWTHSGELQARWVEGKVELDFPAMAYEAMKVPHQFVEIFGFHPVNAVFSGTFFLFEAQDPRLIEEAQPNMKELIRLPMPEVIITARTPDREYDFISRFFAPQLGVPEDPVTGSAHCLLTPYWSEKMGKKAFNAYQASPRGGWLHVEWVGDRVLISGDSALIFQAELLF